jgi:peptidyl-prolyl cis-trans isomerase A (cyclophilin A)
MKYILKCSLALTLLLSQMVMATDIKGQYIQPDNLFPKVKMQTSMGDLIIELDRSRAKITVDNFLGYVARKQYDNTLFHRVEIDFVVQGGGFSTEYVDVKLDKPIVNESGNGLKNEMGTIAMARLTDPHSATSQFYFNVNDNTSLDPGRRWGYAVFGEVTEGLEVLEAMAKVKVDYDENLGYPTVPKKMLILKRVTILKPEPLPEVAK